MFDSCAGFIQGFGNSHLRALEFKVFRMLPKPPTPNFQALSPEPGVSLDSERGNFKLFGLIYWLYLRKFELFGARLLKKRVSKLLHPKPRS